MLLIMVLLDTSPYKTFKAFWFHGLQSKYRPYFNELPSYERFVALMPRLLLPSYLLVHWFSGERSGIYFVDSTKLAVCHNARGRHHKVFRRMAQWGRSSMGWFFELKLHLVINNQGQIMAVRITAANVHDRHPLAALTAGLQGKVFGDKGYISKEMMQQLWQRGLHLITGIDWHRGDMKNHPHAPAGQAIATQALQHRDPIDQTEVTYGVGVHPTPIAQQCLGPYLLLSCRLHPCATQSQHGTSGHARSGLALSIIRVFYD